MEWKSLTVNELIEAMNNKTECFIYFHRRKEYISFKIGKVCSLSGGECYVYPAELVGGPYSLGYERFKGDLKGNLVGTSRSQAYALFCLNNGYKHEIGNIPKTYCELDDCYLTGKEIDIEVIGPRSDEEINECIDKETALYTFMLYTHELFIHKGYISKVISNDVGVIGYMLFVDDEKQLWVVHEERLFYTKQAVLDEAKKVWLGLDG
jgi:hypothetical protein